MFQCYETSGGFDGFLESRLLMLPVFSIIFSLKYIMTEHFLNLFLLFVVCFHCTEKKILEGGKHNFLS